MRKIFRVTTILDAQVRLVNELGVAWTIELEDAPAAVCENDLLTCDATMRDWRFAIEPPPVPEFLREQEAVNASIRAEHAAALVPEVATLDSDKRISEIISEITEHKSAIKRLRKEAESYGFAV